MQDEGLVRMFAAKYGWATRGEMALDRDDIEQEARVALWLGRASWDPARHQCKQSMFAVRNAERAVHEHISRFGYPVGVGRETARRRGSVGRVWNARAQVDDLVSSTSEPEPMLARVKSALRSLPARKQWVLEQVVVHERDMADVGREMGVTRERVRQIVKRSLAMVRKECVE